MNSLAVLISILIVCVFVLGADEVVSIVYDAVLLLSEHRVVICANGLIPSKVIALGFPVIQLICSLAALYLLGSEANDAFLSIAGAFYATYSYCCTD